MKYNTPKQRKKIYEKVLELWANGKGRRRGICGDIRDLINDWKTEDAPFVQKFPELLSQKPKRIDLWWYWWKEDDIRPRINALNAAIQLCN